MEIQKRIIEFAIRFNWLLFVVGTGLAFINTPQKFALGILCGGLIVTLNFHLLKRTLSKAFRPVAVLAKGRSILFSVLAKYYIRFLISGVMIFLLISRNIVDPLGLLAGLSVVVASLTVAIMLELTRFFFKEAV